MSCPHGTIADLLRFLSLLVLSVLGATMMHLLQERESRTTELRTTKKTTMTTATMIPKEAHNSSSSVTSMGGRGVTKRGDQRGRIHGGGGRKNTTETGGHVQLDSTKLPILVMGLPKSGTSSLNYYFKDCGGQRSKHLGCCRVGSIGLAMRDNVGNGTKPLDGMYPEYVDVLTQMDYEASPPDKCFFPQVELLEEIHLAYPNATFILNTRNVSDWVSSVSRWHGMARRIARCNITGFPPANVGTLRDRLLLFYEWHNRRVEEFAERHPSHQLVKFDIYAEDAGTILREAFGIDDRCWGQHNANPAKKRGNATL